MGNPLQQSHYNFQYFASFKALLIVGKARFLWSEYRDEKLFLVFDVFPLRLQNIYLHLFQTVHGSLDIP